jgi:hypothetical protein
MLPELFEIMNDQRLRLLPAEIRCAVYEALPSIFDQDPDAISVLTETWPNHERAILRAVDAFSPLVDQYHSHRQKRAAAGKCGAEKRWESYRQRKQKRKDTRPKEKLTMDQRRDAFKAALNEHYKTSGGKYPKHMYQDFFTFWAAPSTKNPSVMGFEDTRTWSLAGRLATWYQKDPQKYSKGSTESGKLSQTWIPASKHS